MKNRIHFLLFTSYVLLSCTATAQQAGDLDVLFDFDGTTNSNLTPQDDRVHALAVQSDGKIIAAGVSNDGISDNFAITRYNADGAVDQNFGTNGFSTADINNGDDAIQAVAILPNGKIVTAGFAHNGQNYDFAIARWNANGILDGTFGTNGIALVNFGITDRAFSLNIQNDGKIVAAGWVYTGSNYDFGIARLLANGTPDNSFSSDGKMLVDFSSGNDYANSLVIQFDGRIVVAGEVQANNESYIGLTRILSDGALDNTFGLDGKITTKLVGTEVGNAVAFQSDGKIVVAGYTGNNPANDILLVRYNTDGTLDNSFDTDGIVTTQLTDLGDYANAVAIQSDGKILVGGTVAISPGADCVLLRYNPDGSLDQGFSGDGWVATDWGTIQDRVYALAIQPDGNILLGGSGEINQNNQFAVARYLSGAVVGTEIINTPAIEIYPNPAQSQIILYGATAIITGLELYDIAGRPVYTWQTPEPTSSALLLQLPPGLPSGRYQLGIINQKERAFKAIIIQK